MPKFIGRNIKPQCTHTQARNLHNAHHHAQAGRTCASQYNVCTGPSEPPPAYAATENEMHNNSPVRIVRIDQFTCVRACVRVYVFSGRNRLHNTHSLWPYVFMCAFSIHIMSFVHAPNQKKNSTHINASRTICANDVDVDGDNGGIINANHYMNICSTVIEMVNMKAVPKSAATRTHRLAHASSPQMCEAHDARALQAFRNYARSPPPLL